MTDTDISSATPINLPLERSLYVGDILRGILYGMELVTFFAAVYCVTYRPSRYCKSQKFYVIYGGILLLLTTIELSLHALWGQLMWIDYRNYPGGPLGFYLVSEAAWYTATALAAGVAANILGDGLLKTDTMAKLTLVSMLHNLGFTMAYHRLSGTDILGFLCGLYHHGGGVCHPRHSYPEREAYQARCAVGLAERGLEYHRHLDDLLSSPADASTNTRGALPRDVQHVYKHRHDAHRVCRALFHRWYRSRRHRGAEGTARICIWLCLECILLFLPANDHPPGCHGSWVAQGDPERAQHCSHIRESSPGPRAKSGSAHDDSQCRRPRFYEKFRYV